MCVLPTIGVSRRYKECIPLKTLHHLKHSRLSIYYNAADVRACSRVHAAAIVWCRPDDVQFVDTDGETVTIRPLVRTQGLEPWTSLRTRTLLIPHDRSRAWTAGQES